MGYRYIRRDLLVNIILLSTVGGEEVWNDASFPKSFCGLISRTDPHPNLETSSQIWIPNTRYQVHEPLILRVQNPSIIDQRQLYGVIYL